MQLVVLSIHILVCVALIGLVLLQRSEGGALGMGGGGSGALMSGRGAADALARMTSFAGGFFLVTSLALTFISGAAQTDSRSVFDMLPRQQQTTTPPATTPQQQPATEPARPDPTESSAPQSVGSQLASALSPPSAEAAVPQTVAPSPTDARTRAQPLEGRTGGAVASIPASQRTTTAPQTAAPRQTPPPQTTAARQSGAGTTQAQTTPARTTPLIIPGLTSGTETDTSPAAQLAAESSEDGVTAVRRERAGPDQ